MMMNPSTSNNAHASVLSTLSPYQALTIIDNLKEQHAIYKQVQDVLLQKKVSILKQAVTDFPEQDKSLKAYRKQLDALEQKRLNLLHEFWPNALEPVHAKMMILAMPEDQRQIFNQVRSELKYTLDQVASLQAETQALLNASLDWVSQSMAWVKHHIQSEKKELTYTAKGTTKGSKTISTMQKQI